MIAAVPGLTAAQRDRISASMRSNCSAKNPEAMKPELLALTPFYQPTLEALDREYVVHKLWEARDPDALIKQVASERSRHGDDGTAGLQARAYRCVAELEVIACFGTSHGSLDLARGERARDRRYQYAGLDGGRRGRSCNRLLIAVMRRIGEADRFIRAGKWPAGHFPMSADLRGKTCGIIGYGGIGSAVAKRVMAFGMSVSITGRARNRASCIRTMPNC